MKFNFCWAKPIVATCLLGAAETIDGTSRAALASASKARVLFVAAGIGGENPPVGSDVAVNDIGQCNFRGVDLGGARRDAQTCPCGKGGRTQTQQCNGRQCYLCGFHQTLFAAQGCSDFFSVAHKG